MTALPPPRTPGRYAVELVCLGNICRSPMAHVVLEERLARAGLDDRVTVRSSGTGGWHVGEPMDRRAADTLTAAGHDPSRHRARRFEARPTDDPAQGEGRPDLVLAMDASNLADLRDLLPPHAHDRLMLFRDLDPQAPTGDRDVPDPYYGGPDGFAHVLDLVERTTEALVGAIAAQLDGS